MSFVATSGVLTDFFPNVPFKASATLLKYFPCSEAKSRSSSEGRATFFNEARLVVPRTVLPCGILLSSFSFPLIPFGTRTIPWTASIFIKDCIANSRPAPLPADIKTMAGIPSNSCLDHSVVV
ncbi:hypothetical protein D3C71_1167260 [compost metagenome]